MKEWIQKTAAQVMGWLDELLFPSDVICLCCDRALSEDAIDGICPACQEALEHMNRKQEERERNNPAPIPEEMIYVHAAFPYEGQARRLVHHLKFTRIRAAHVPLAKAMVFLPSGEEEIIVPVPTDPVRLRQRGYNQAELLARYIGRELGMEVALLLKRKEKRRPQTGLPAWLRRKNLLGCMIADPAVNGKKILLVDDVYTTGSTAREAARALLDAGAASVAMFAATRTTGELLEEKDPFSLLRKWGHTAKSLKNHGKTGSEL